MQTPFTPHFEQANIPLTQVDHRPFEPHYTLPFIRPSCTTYWVGSGCRLIHRWHDGFDVFVAALEIRIDHPAATVVELPVESLLHDVHLLYQLEGETQLPEPVLPSQHYMLIYAAPDRSTLHIRADRETGSYTALVVVPKGKWVARTPPDPAHPLHELLHRVRQQHHEHHFLDVTPISNRVRVWLHLLLTLPRYRRMRMDSALNHPVAHLVEAHLAEYGHLQQQEAETSMIESARELVVELLARNKNGIIPTAESVGAALHVPPQQIRAVHYQRYRQKFNHYIVAARVEEARKRLSRGDSIASIAFALGWTDDTHFIKQFKKYTGVTPGRFAKKFVSS